MADQPAGTEAVGPARRGWRSITFGWALLGIVVVGVAIRVVYIFTARQDFLHAFADADPFRLGDAYLYQRGAVLLAEGKGFINPYQLDLFGIRQEDASHPPLFMLWLTIPALLGITSATASALWSVVLGAGTIALVGITGRTMVGPRVGLVAAVFAAVYPNVFSHDAFLQSETMAIFTVTLTMWVSYRFLTRPTLWGAVWVAAGCALAMLARSELALLVPVLWLPLVLRVRAVPGRTRVRWLAAGSLAILVLVGPWVIFNLARFEKPVTLSDNFGYTLLTASCDRTYYGDGIGYWDVQCAAPTYDRIKAPENDRSVNEVTFRRVALDYIGNHKGRFAVVTLVRWARFTGAWDLLHNFDQVDKDVYPEGRERPIAVASALMYFAFVPFAVLGGVALWRRRVSILPVLAPIVASLIAVTLTFYMNRYRASAETALCLLAAVGVDALWRRYSGRVRGREPGAGAGLTAGG